MPLRFPIGVFMLFLLLATIKPCHAGFKASPDTLSSGTDSNWISDYTNKLTSRAFLLFQDASLLINAQNIDKIVYHPNVNIRVGLAAFWKWFGLGVSINNPLYRRDQDKYGKTSSLDLRVNAFGRKIAAELFVQRYKGFYVSSPVITDDLFYLLPNMRSFSIGVAGYWIYNFKRFSIRAAFIQNERQKKSAGSLVVRPSFLFYNLSSDSGIIPRRLINEYQIPSEFHIVRGDFTPLAYPLDMLILLYFLKTFISLQPFFLVLRFIFIRTPMKGTIFLITNSHFS